MSDSATARILYCHCAHAQVVPPEVKQAVLRSLACSGASFDAVPDLCEMSARRDPALARLACGGPVKILACYPRAVKWLFHGAGAPLQQDQTQVLNMRTDSASQIIEALQATSLSPNLPAGKVTAADAPVPTPNPAAATTT